MEVEGPAAATVQRLAPWSVILLVVSALTLAITVLLDWWPVAIGAGLVGLGGVTMLVITSRTNRDAPRM